MTTALSIFFGVMAYLSIVNASISGVNGRKKAQRNWFIVFIISLAIVSLIIGGVM